MSAELPARWSFVGDGFRQSVVETLGISVEDRATGRLSMPVDPYHRNSFGAVQGGAMALLAEAAGAEALHAARPRAGPVAVTDLQVAYLALGRTGPITSRATVLDAGTGPRSNAVVELFDGGPEGRLTTLVSVGAVAMGSGSDAPGVAAADSVPA